MKKIRQEVFETNSSSTHSVTICSDSSSLVDYILPSPDGIITIQGDQFGWQWEKFNDARTKASYYAQLNSENLEKLNLLAEVIMDQTGAEQVNFDYHSLENGYVDHQSTGNNEEFVTKEDIRNFIFNKESWLYLGNDNDEPPGGFYE